MMPRRAPVVIFLGLVFAGCQGGGQEPQAPKGAGGPGPTAPLSTADRKRRSVENLRRIAAAMKEYAQTDTCMPPAAYLDRRLRPRFQYVVWPAEELARHGGKLVLKGQTVPLFSWRVALLPYLGEEDLARQFKMDEPWDSSHNQKLLAPMPAVYAPDPAAREAGRTYYQVFVGRDTPFNGMEPPRLPAKFVDGTANTFLVVEAAEAVPWTKPQDLPYDARRPLPPLGGLFEDGFHAAMADGTVYFVPRGAPEKLIRAAITPAGDEPPGLPGEPVK